MTILGVFKARAKSKLKFIPMISQVYLLGYPYNQDDNMT